MYLNIYICLITHVPEVITRLYVNDTDGHYIGMCMGVHLQIVIQIEGSDPVARFRVWPFMLAISGDREVDTTSLLLRVPFILDHCLMTFFFF